MARVYYLDDEPDLLRSFERFMKRMGHEVATFTEPAAAIEACRRAPPTVLLIDYRLAGTTADQVIQDIDRDIRKVLVTGELAVKASDGFMVVLSKPFRFRDLHEMIRLLAEPSRE